MIKTTKEAYESLDKSDKEFVDKLNKKDRNKTLREVAGEEGCPRPFGKNYFNRKKS